jgi:hypothetical protein
MPSHPGISHLVLATGCLFALAACAPGAPAPPRCHDDARCPVGSRCISGACVANAAPIADLQIPAGTLEAHVLLSFDGSGSSDPDAGAGDGIAAYAWSCRAIAAGCAPPAVAGIGPLALVRFACAGRYAIDLAVSDNLGATAAVTRELEIAPYSGPALVTVADDLALDHACGPSGCEVVGEVRLSASAPGSEPAELSFLWTVEPPPDRPLEPGRRVIFEPGPDVADPAVAIVTDGQAISGDWIFRVEVRDGAGLIGSAATRISVKNRPPVVVKAIPLVHHRFDGARFLAEAEIPVAVVDPDGDVIVGRSLQRHHVGDGEDAAFSAVLSADLVTIGIVVPYRTPEDALHLIGGDGLERTIVFTATDVNGGTTVDSWPIVVANRAPFLVSTPAASAVLHWYDAGEGAYRAVAPLSTWYDPDGDPLVQVPGAGTGDAVCPQIEVLAGVASVSCSLPYAGAPAVANFAGTHLVAQRIQDPWDEAPASVATFFIENRPPEASVPDVYVPTACTLGECCYSVIGRCYRNWTRFAPVESTAVVYWSDPDQDPLALAIAGSGFAAEPWGCVESGCAARLEIPELHECGDFTTRGLTATVTDGLSEVAASSTVWIYCAP